MSFVIDKEAFYRRMKKLYTAWDTCDDDNPLSKADVIITAVGSGDDTVYSKSTALQNWLFGYELTDTMMVLCQTSILFLSSKKKIDFLRQVETGKENDYGIPQINLLTRDKGDKDKGNFIMLLDAMKDSKEGKCVGEFSKDKFPGEFMQTWRDVVKTGAFEHVDISASVAYLTSPKEDSEQRAIQRACQVTCDVFTKFLREQIMTIVDTEKRVPHSKLSDGVESALQNKKYVTNVDPSQLDLCYPAIIQSGGDYNLKYSTVSSDKDLSFDTIICALGTRYKSYCSNLVRTLMVDPLDDMKKMYEFLLKVHEKVLDTLRDGVKLSDVYHAAESLVKSERPKQLESMNKTFGFAIGLEFREASLLISSKNDTRARKGMMFNINVGFSKLKNGDNKTYALFVADTVLVNHDSPATCMTKIKKLTKNVSILLKNEDEVEAEKQIEMTQRKSTKTPPEILGRGQRRNAILDSRTRTEAPGEEKRQAHQRELAKRVNEDAKERLKGQKAGTDDKKMRKSNSSYKSQSHIPQEPEIAELKLFVDRKSESVILPVFGIPTPYHISTVKNISQSVEGDYTYLRINFFHPGSTVKNDGTIFPQPDATFVKEITFRSSNSKEPGEISSPSSNLNMAFRIIKEVQKKFRTREAEEREKEGIVQQDTLVVNNNRGNPRLRDLYIKPNIVSKRISGTLEAHTNGFRFTSVRGDKVDILYNNIKHAFFQPCDGEMVILLHFHLKHAILFGKKKNLDIQFLTEVGEITTDLGKHQHMHDRDDLHAEQQERELRSKLKQTFKSFCEKVEAITKQQVEFDTPFKELGFQGAPFRSTVLLQPTSGCLVNLTEWPPFVISLDEIELVHFERVQFHLKNFDIVFVYKDYVRKVSMVNAVTMGMLDHVKEWLNSCDIRYSEGIQSLNWAKIMKTITDDLDGFFDNGGWTFLDPESGGEDDHDDESEASNYNPSGSESGGVSDESSDEASGDDSNWSGEEEDASESGEDDLGSSEESGKDWDELEDEARRADAGEDESDNDKRSLKRKRPDSGHSDEKHKHPDKHKSSGKHKSPSKHGSSSKHGSPSKHGSSSSKHGSSSGKHGSSSSKHGSSSSKHGSSSKHKSPSKHKSEKRHGGSPPKKKKK